MLSQDQCRQVISDYLKDQSTQSIHRRLEYAKNDRMDYVINCLLALSDRGMAHGVSACEERLRLGLPRYGLDAQRVKPNNPEQAFRYLGRNDKERNHLMVGILEAELLRRELESAPPVIAKTTEAEPSAINESEYVAV